MDSLKETKFLINKYNIRANKNLGQNFLIDDNIINTIIDKANIGEEDLVIEIGPGLGTLTSLLLEKAKKVICIELDKRMVEILKERFKLYKSFEIIQGDILKLNLKEKIDSIKSEYKNIKVVANLPYYITTQIVTKLLEDELDLESITIMIQKEVADRLVETPGGKNTGAITYCINYYCESETIVEVPKEAFIPSPKVTSKVIKLKLRKELLVKTNKEEMFRIIKSAFTQRRKTLLNSLTNTNILKTKEQGMKILKKLGIDVNIRPEKLTLEDFANITNEKLLKNL